jgi:hypothetical protein
VPFDGGVTIEKISESPSGSRAVSENVTGVSWTVVALASAATGRPFASVTSHAKLT